MSNFKLILEQLEDGPWIITAENEDGDDKYMDHNGKWTESKNKLMRFKVGPDAEKWVVDYAKQNNLNKRDGEFVEDGWEIHPFYLGKK
jgi:hypothetical protein